MVRIALIVLASLGLGAGGMWLASNFKLRLEPIANGRPDEPAKLPESVTRETVILPNDPAIRPAAATIAVPLAIAPLTLAAPEPQPTPKITHVLETLAGVPNPVSWPVISSGTRIHASAERLTLKVENLPGGNNLRISLNDAPQFVEAKALDASLDIERKTVTLSVAKLFPASNDKQVRIRLRNEPQGNDTAPSAPSEALTILRSRTNPENSQITVSNFATSRYLETNLPAGSFDELNRLPIVNGYFRVRGNTSIGETVNFFLVEENGSISELSSSKAKSIRRSVGEWEYELTLDRRESRSKAWMLVRGYSGLDHFDARQLIPLEWVSKSAPSAPEFADEFDVAGSDPPQKAAVTPLAGGSKFKLGTAPGVRLYRANVAGEFSVAVAKPTDAEVVLLYLDGQVNPRAIDVSNIAEKSVTFRGLTVAGEGDHVFAAASANGGDPPGPRTQLTVRVHTIGPRAERATAPTFGSGAQRKESIKVQFSGTDIDPATAGDGANYNLVHNESGVSKTITKVSYDATSKTATWEASDILPGTYTLTVKSGGIRDLYGNALVRADGVSGDQTFELSTGGSPAPSLPSVVASAFTLTTGPNVEFKEFEPRKTLLNGFNPADRVETRVVRLYYNRDAARVVQVVNRDAKSWNALGVEVRRRAADRTRDEANAATDERKRQESLAVQAAQDARAAENRLRDLQGRLATARTEAATAISLVSRRQLELEGVQRTVGRELAETFPDPTQSRVSQLSAEIEKLKRDQSAVGGVEIKEEDVLDAQKSLAVRQREQAATIAAARDELATDPAVAKANKKIEEIQTKLRMPDLTSDQKSQLSIDLDLATQEQAQVVAGYLTRNPTLAAKLDDAAVAVQKQQLEVDRKQAALSAVKELIAKQKALDGAKNDLIRAQTATGDATALSSSSLQTEIRRLQSAASTATTREQAIQSEIATALADVQAKRAREVELTLKARDLDQKELRARESQFRSEVAAAKEDPDIYAAGKPESDDPVRQCSLSVIGEGLIQIRGPVKGVNIIRTMINQIDAPTGQVRIGVHTIQVNGERVERMNRVVANIQRYLDHARFLTTQSSQMLRKAVTAVAARKADEAAATQALGCTQADRDLKYLHVFFGKDFVDELRSLDSEFLRTGNKLLSLHSMDSTSLSAALMLLALAKNEIRMEILQEFHSQVETKLPEAENIFYQAGLACPTKCEACYDKKFCMLASNAKFESFRGFFNLDLQGNDTLTPIQREFIRLAQIFKMRLVTELELKQRVIERSLLEDRLGDYQKELQEAKDRDDESRRALIAVQDKLQTAIADATIAFAEAVAVLDEVESEIGSQDRLLEALSKTAGYTTTNLRDGTQVIRGIEGVRGVAPLTVQVGSMTKTLPKITLANEPKNDKITIDKTKDAWLQAAFKDTARYINRFFYSSVETDALFKTTQDALNQLAQTETTTVGEVVDVHMKLKAVLSVIRDSASQTRKAVASLLTALRKDRADLAEVLTKYHALRIDVIGKLRDGEVLKQNVQTLFTEKLDPPFRALQEAAVKFQAAQRRAQLARRPLDEKKLLDMLIDEMEDKYIELLDGTRAHTANVDNYLKSLSTALEDDFNTQFHNPAFAKIRSLGAGWDVQLGQIETTTVLTNNRVFAKVAPAASMEFDLPKRDIFIKEAFKGAKAAVDEYGALLNDPTFLALTKLYGGTPTAATFGNAGVSAVRGVLPTLPNSADELLMAQAGPNRKEFGAALEALIPDPAVYKFETGTGYEIRPVMSPDGQAVVFGFDYLYTTDVREPVRADEKHLGRVRRHFVHTDVQLSNFELREVSKYWVSLKAARTGRGVQLLQDVPGVGALFRPLPSASSSLQQNLIYSQAALFPTLFDLMGLRYAPTIADIDPETTKNDEFVVRGRRDYLRQYIFDYGASRVDDALRILTGERRPDLYRSQHTIPWEHPNGYRGPGMRQSDATLEEGYDPREAYPKSEFRPGMHLQNLSVPGGTSRPQFHDDPPIGFKGPSIAPPGLAPPTGGGFSEPSFGSLDYSAKPLGTTLTRPTPLPKSVPAPLRAPGAPSIPPPAGITLPPPRELPPK